MMNSSARSGLSSMLVKRMSQGSGPGKVRENEKWKKSLVLHLCDFENILFHDVFRDFEASWYSLSKL